MAKPTKHYGKWRIRFIGDSGKRMSYTFDTKADALKVLRSIRIRKRLRLTEKALGEN